MKYTENELRAMALEAMQRAYSPYSNCKVGAALLAKSGKVYLGCNIENASYSPTICAERVAFVKAVSEGEREFDAIAVAGSATDKVDGYFPPCGVCRQVMSEFCDLDAFKVILVKNENEHKTVTLRELLPYSFGSENLK